MNTLRSITNSILWNKKFDDEFSRYNDLIKYNRSDFFFDWAASKLFEVGSDYKMNRGKYRSPEEQANAAFIYFVNYYFEKEGRNPGIWPDILACAYAYSGAHFFNWSGELIVSDALWSFSGVHYCLNEANEQIKEFKSKMALVNLNKVEDRALDQLELFESGDEIDFQAHGLLRLTEAGLNSIQIAQKIDSPLEEVLAVFKFLEMLKLVNRRWNIYSLPPAFRVPQWDSRYFELSMQL